MTTNIHRVPYFFFLEFSYPSTFLHPMLELFLFPHSYESLSLSRWHATLPLFPLPANATTQFSRSCWKKKCPKRFHAIVGSVSAIVVASGQSCWCPNSGQSHWCPSPDHSNRCQPKTEVQVSIIEIDVPIKVIVAIFFF
jgi:hypothetical protein